MKRMTGSVFTGAVLAAGLLWPSAALAHANPALCQYPLGDKMVTIPCGADPQAEPGMAGNMPGQLPADMPGPADNGRPPNYGPGDGWYPGCQTVPMC
jgi:hypothetical protein